MTRVFLFAGLVSIMALGSAAGEAAAQERSCSVIDNVYSCTIVRTAVPGGSAVNVDIDGPGPLPLVWSRWLSNGLPGALFDCVYHETSGLDTIETRGVGWAVAFTNTETGAHHFVGWDCEYPGEDPPQPPPPPPTPEAIIRESGARDTLTTGLSPSVEARGVSQLESWLWCVGAQNLQLSPELDGYRIVAEVGVTGLEWRVDGPDGLIALSAQTCGSAPDPYSDGASAAARWTPNRPGTSTIALTSHWGGTWSLTYTQPGIGTVDLGTFDFPSVPAPSPPFQYDVYEIQTVGVAPPPNEPAPEITGP